MVEPVTTVGMGAIAAYLGKDGLQKLLGPTADYLGVGLRDFAQKRVENICRIFTKATEKLGNRIETAGEVPPRVLKAVLEEGSFCDSELAAEYFGGVLASSRTDNGRDDRGARIAKVIDSLSTYQLRTHYLIYSNIKVIFAQSGLSFNMNDRPKMKIFLPYSGYLPAMDFNESEELQTAQILSHSFFGLHADGLIEGDWRYGQQEHLKDIFKEATEGGIICQPSALGAELFLNAFGHSDKPLEYVFDEAFSPKIANIPPFVQGAVAVTKPIT